ncbi:MAG: Mov34/MPN/PAD-1 family protein [bacterium]
MQAGVPSGLAASLVLHAEAEAPREACGLVVQAADGPARARPARNLAASPGLFLLDPAALVASRRREERLWAIYHSHCDAPPVLSTADLAAALVEGAPAWPGVEQWIIEVSGGRAVGLVRYAWCAARRDFVVAPGPAAL